LQRQLVILAAFCLLSVAPALAASPPSYILVDEQSGKVLDEDNSAALWHPASVTKLMTAYVTFEALRAGELKMTSPVRVSAHALAQAPAKMGFKVGTVINVDNALKMMLVKSANDIAVAIAETVGGSEEKFTDRMNATATRLGMLSTHYDNANGLPDDGQITTARDLAVLALAIRHDFPEYTSYFGIPAIKAGKRVLRSENALLERYRGTTGMKTGFVCASGYNIVATATRGGRSLVAVVLGASSGGGRAEFTAHLLDQGFNAFGTLFGGAKPELASFEAHPTLGSPADLHDEVCARRPNRQEDAGDDDSSDEPQSSALVPRFVLMAPVPVFTGRADILGKADIPGKDAPAEDIPGKAAAAPSAAAAAPAATAVATAAVTDSPAKPVRIKASASGIPLPRLRPDLPARPAGQ
jgi:D-alanyl-D-alanine carboxypeptidase